jgi:hypothetical protein
MTYCFDHVVSDRVDGPGRKATGVMIPQDAALEEILKETLSVATLWHSVCCLLSPSSKSVSPVLNLGHMRTYSAFGDIFWPIYFKSVNGKCQSFFGRVMPMTPNAS